MAEKVGEVYYDVVLRQEELETKFTQLEDRFNSVGKTGTKVFNTLGKVVAGGAIFAGLKKAVSLAIDAQETFSKFDAVFEGVSEQANNVAKNFAQNFGLAKDEAKALLASTGDLLTGFQFTDERALELSKDVNELAVDLASFSNAQGGAESVSRALTSALLGETESLKTYGIAIRQADVDARLAAKGLSGLTGTALQQEKAVATLELATRQAGKAVGDYAATQDSAANIQRRLVANIRDIAVGLGNEIIPSFTRLGSAFEEATREGGALATIAKGIGFALGKLIQVIVVLIRGFELIANSQKNTNEALIEGQKVLEKYNFTTLEQIKLAGLRLKSTAQLNSEIALLSERTDESSKRAVVLRKAILEQGDAIEKAGGKGKESYSKFTEEVDILFGKLDKEEKKPRKPIQNLGNDAEATSKKVKKLRSDFEKFYDSLTALGLDNQEKIERQQDDRLKKLQEFRDAGVVTEKEYQDARVAIAKDANSQINNLRIQQAQAVLGATSALLGQISEINNLTLQNETAQLQAKQDRELEILGARFDAERSLIEGEVQTKNARDRKLSELDKKRALEEKAIQEKQAKDQARLKMQSAIQQRNLSIFQTLVSIPETAFQAYKSAQVLPFPASAIVGASLATATTALGFKKLDLIRKAPLPQLQAGATVSSRPGEGTVAQIGEGFDDEIVAPLNNQTFERFGQGLISALGRQQDGGTITAGEELSLTLNFQLGSEFITRTVQTSIDNRELIINFNDLSTVA